MNNNAINYSGQTEPIILKQQLKENRVPARHRWMAGQAGGDVDRTATLPCPPKRIAAQAGGDTYTSSCRWLCTALSDCQ